jgi:hypothetical protein
MDTSIMTYTKAYIRARLCSLVSDRSYCLEHGIMTKSMNLLMSCTRLQRELEFTRQHGHNAHTALVRRCSGDIISLACTLGTKHHLREEILTMVSDLNRNNHDKTIQTQKTTVHQH